jgi:hypothetical protein
MTTWQEFTDEVPEFAARVEARLRAFVHLTMATIRADGGPRISGNEIRFKSSHLYVAGMPMARRWDDLRRDPRVAIHSGSASPDDPSSWAGDAKVSGIAHEVTDPDQRAAFGSDEKQMPPGDFALFSIEPTEVTSIGLNPAGDALVIETWKPGRGLIRHQR